MGLAPGPTTAVPTASRAARCQIWGILNVTPDSFSDGGFYLENAFDRAGA